MYKILNQGFDHVEFIVNDIPTHAKMYERMGFEKVGEHTNKKKNLKAELWQQGFIRILLSQPIEKNGSEELEHKFLKAHGDGVTVLAVEVDNAKVAYQETMKRGARSALEPVTYESPEGTVTRAEIYTPADLRYAFIERKFSGDYTKPALFSDGFVVKRLESPSPQHLRVIDHLTNNVSIGEMKKWVDWYKDVFGFVVTRHFEITTGRTGLVSDVVQSENGKIIVPINEATEPESQVQEFVERFKGPGVQHLALLSTNIMETIPSLRARDYKFLSVPDTYYDAVPGRVPNIKEPLSEIQKRGILVDGNKDGYLLQLFTEEMVGPFFFEYIERRNDKGFGEGNFKALFEAIERDQVKRGVLKN